MTEDTDRLHTLLKPGDTVYTVLRHVSRSGMSRLIDLYAIVEDQPVYLSGYAGPLLEGRDPKSGACRARGCGMDMGFHLVYNLSARLFPDGFECIGTGCPSNDHSNGDRNYEPHQHSSGGYALKQHWL